LAGQWGKKCVNVKGEYLEKACESGNFGIYLLFVKKKKSGSNYKHPFVKEGK
jgi:hypothetical protein